MPLPPVVVPHYDTVTKILNTARHRLNQRIKTLQSTGGQILEETDAFTHQVFNTAYREMQARLQDVGYAKFNKEIILTGCPIVSSTDPASQTFVDWNQYFDGTNYQTTPVLPSDMIQPLWMSERQTGVNAIFPATPNMENMVGGLPGWQKKWCNGCWQWREDKLWMPGSLYSMDLRIGYAAYLPDIDNIGQNRWFNQEVPIMRCLEPLAAFTASEYCKAKRFADPEMREVMMLSAAEFQDEAIDGTNKIFRRDTQTNANVNVRRIPRNRGARGGRF